MTPEPIGTPHDHRTVVPGCHRCEIGRDEGERTPTEPCTEHLWTRPTESAVRCVICGLDADEMVLGLRADEATEGDVDE